MKNLTIIFVSSVFCLMISSCSFHNKTSAENVVNAENIENTTESETVALLANLTQETINLKISGKDLPVVINRGKTAKPLYFNMHDDENTSVEAAKVVADKFGGTVIELKHSGERLIDFKLNNKNYKIDPNRIFTKIGISKTLDNYGDTTPEAEAEVDKFAKKLVSDFLKQSDVIVALHNNSNDEYSAKNYEKGKKNETDAAKVFIDPANDVDDFFFVTEEKHFNKLKEKGFNVILQDNAKVTDDGSLSVYCGNEKITYINVEAQHGHLVQQIKMLEALREVLAN